MYIFLKDLETWSCILNVSQTKGVIIPKLNPYLNLENTKMKFTKIKQCINNYHRQYIRYVQYDHCVYVLTCLILIYHLKHCHCKYSDRPTITILTLTVNAVAFFYKTRW